MNTYYIYILSSPNKSVLYIGVTNNLQRRIAEHKSKLIEGFSKKYNCTNLVYFEKHNLIEKAILREKQLKTWKREWKENLINSENTDWIDLYATAGLGFFSLKDANISINAGGGIMFWLDRRKSYGIRAQGLGKFALDHSNSGQVYPNNHFQYSISALIRL